MQAVVVLGHGSRNPNARQVLNQVAGLLALQTGWKVVPASLQFDRPSLEETVRDLHKKRYRRVIVAPYLLFAGNHVGQDIPEKVESLREEFPGLSMEITEPLGLDLRMVSVLESRVRNAVQREGESAGFGSTAPVPPEAIEEKSFAIIEQLLTDASWTPGETSVVKRVVHATGDPSLAGHLLFSPAAAEEGAAALAAGSPVYCDVNMVRSGVAPSLRRIGREAHCLVEATETQEVADREGITRTAAAVRVLGSRLNGAVIAIGNAPTALQEVVLAAREQGIRPALVVGVPVGFVGAAEAKEALVRSDLPYISLPGLRGGSPVAVATVNALARVAAERVKASQT